MKRLLIFVGLAGLFVAGCGEDSITCKYIETDTLNGEQEKVEAVNKISYNEKYVTKEYQVIKGYSGDSSSLDDFSEEIKSFNKLDGCDGTVKIDGDAFTMTMTIDYTKINIDELDELPKSELIKNGKVKIADLQEYYENRGFICK